MAEMDRKPAPKDSVCCGCKETIPEGTVCLQKTLRIGFVPGDPTLEEVLEKTQPFTTCLCLRCAEGS